MFLCVCNIIFVEFVHNFPGFSIHFMLDRRADELVAFYIPFGIRKINSQVLSELCETYSAGECICIQGFFSFFSQTMNLVLHIAVKWK